VLVACRHFGDSLAATKATALADIDQYGPPVGDRSPMMWPSRSGIAEDAGAPAGTLCTIGDESCIRVDICRGGMGIPVRISQLRSKIGS
jgi:hypothetical protein